MTETDDVATKDQVGGASTQSLLAKFGFGGAPDVQFCWRVIAIFLLLYAISFAVFYPNYATNHDEANYIRQVHLLLKGTSTIPKIDPMTGVERLLTVTTYPLATAIITAPFVALFGERAAFAVACLTLILAVVVTARWLQHAGRSPAFALLLLGFPPMLVMGRVAMSDVPSTAWVALGFYAFWRGLDAEGRAGYGWWLGSGFIAGASLAFRASNPVLFVPLFFGTVVRREVKAVALVAGGVAGLGVRLISQAAIFGDALYERSAYRWSPETVDERLWLYLLALLIFVPGGLVLSMLYRGPRRPEVVSTIAGFVLLYLFQEYSTVETGFSKRLILGLRYLLPVLPMVAFAMAESSPRLFAKAMEPRSPEVRTRLAGYATTLLSVWLFSVAVGVLAVHPAFASWSSTQDSLREAIEEYIPNDSVLVTNFRGTRKFVPELRRRFPMIPTDNFGNAEMDALLARHGTVYLALLDRTDSDWWREETKANAAFLKALRGPRELLVQRTPSETDDLRIWKLTRSSPVSDTSPQ